MTLSTGCSEKRLRFCNSYSKKSSLCRKSWGFGEFRIPNSELVIENPEVIRAKDLDPMEANFIIEAVHSTIELEAEEEKGEAEKGEEDRGYVEEEKGEEEERAPVTYAEYMMA